MKRHIGTVAILLIGIFIGYKFATSARSRPSPPPMSGVQESARTELASEQRAASGELWLADF